MGRLRRRPGRHADRRGRLHHRQDHHDRAAEAEFGTPTTGWTFTVAITGQDGYRADQAIPFTTNPGAYTLGLCPVGGTEAICSLSPIAVPEVMDTITSIGVSQDTELNPTLGPVVLQGVTVP